MLDKLLYDEEVKRCMACFEQQFHYGVFYAYMKLREQEIRNVMWISECVAQVGDVLCCAALRCHAYCRGSFGRGMGVEGWVGCDGVGAALSRVRLLQG